MSNARQLPNTIEQGILRAASQLLPLVYGEELLRRYEPVIRLEVRRQRRGTRLRRLFDSLDQCQWSPASDWTRKPHEQQHRPA